MNKAGRKAVFAIFDERTSLENAIDTLKQRGFQSNDISALLASTESTKEFAHKKATKSPEGATAGAVTGAVVGGALGWLAGIGSLAIPGVGPFVAAGPIMAALAGLGLVGTVGGIAGALIGFGIPEYEAKRYESVIQSGGMLFSVHADNAELLVKAKQILKDCGAHDISAMTEEKSDVENIKSSSDFAAMPKRANNNLEKRP